MIFLTLWTIERKSRQNQSYGSKVMKDFMVEYWVEIK
jgi:hypothetical protein